jgi:tetratricopeptide (TPR) repeat protein
MPKRRRINTKFLLISGIVVMTLLATAGVLYKFVLRKDPAKFRALAETQIAAGDWEKARDNVGTAIKYTRKPDPTLWIMLGDVLTQLSSKDAEAEDQAAGAWSNAVEIDPQDIEIQRRLLRYHRDRSQIKFTKNVQAYDNVRESAKKILDIKSDDKEALIAMHTSWITQWLNGIATDDRKIDEAVTALRKVQQMDPADAEPPLYIARVDIYRAVEKSRQREFAEAKKLFASSEKTMTDALAAGQEKNAGMHDAYGRTLQALAAFDRPPSSRVATTQQQSIADLPKEDRAPAIKQMIGYLNRALEQFKLAHDNVKPEDPLFAEIVMNYGRQVLEMPTADPDRPRDQMEKEMRQATEMVEKIYRDAVKARPSEQGVRLQLAKLVSRDPTRREEAIKILSEPYPRNEAWVGVKGAYARHYDIETQIDLLHLQLDVLSNTREREKREPLLAEVQSNYDKLSGKVSGEHAAFVHIRGRIQLARGQAVEAIQTLDRALKLYPAGRPERYELIFQLASAYIGAQQTGRAKELLREILVVNQLHTPSRLMLADLLIREGNIKGTNREGAEGAAFHIDFLERQLGKEHPLVMRLRFSASEREGKGSEEAVAAYKALPEKTLGDRFAKAQIAAGQSNWEESIRLLESIRAEKPDSLDIVQPLVGVYLQNNQRDKALAVVDAAIKLHPQQAGLPLMRQQIENPEKAKDIRRERIPQITDPLRREMAWVEYYIELGDEQQAFAHLDEAAKIAPDDPRVNDLQFTQALVRKDWDRAGALISKMAARNQDSADGQVYRIRLAEAQGKLDQAYEQALKLTQIRPEFASSYVRLGDVLRRQGEDEQAIHNYQLALERQTENEEAIRGLITCHYNLKQYGKPSTTEEGRKQEATGAKKYIELGQRLFPDNPAFKEVALAWELQFGDPDKAIATREKAVKDSPDNARAWRDLCVAYLAAGQTKSGAGFPGGGGNDAGPAPAIDEKAAQVYYTKARDTLAQAAAKFPEEPGFTSQLITAHLALKDVPAAEKVMLEFTSRDQYKGKPETAMSVAEFYVRANQPEKAEKALRDFLATAPDNVDVQLKLAAALGIQKRIDDAMKVLDAHNANDPRVQQQRVELLVTAGRTEEAAKFVDEALAAKQTPALQKMRARIDMASGKLREGRQRIDQVLAATPNDVEALYLRGLATMVDPHGDLNSAIDDFNKVVAQQPGRIDARVYLADAYRRRNLPEDAIRTLEAAVRAAPTEKSLRLRLLDLYSTHQPPFWTAAQGLLKETRSTPQFADDLDFIHAEASMWMRRKDYAKAVDLIKLVMAKAPNNAQVAATYFTALLEKRDYQALLAETDKWLKAHPDSWWVHQYRGSAYGRNGLNNSQAALNEFAKGIEIAKRGTDPDAIASLLTAVGVDVSPDEARKVLEPMAAKDVRWKLLLAELLDRTGDVNGAIAQLDQVLADPALSAKHLEAALKHGAMLYLRQKPTPNLQKAIDVYRRLLKEIPNEFTAMNNLAALLVEPGPTYSPQEAVQFSTRMIELTARQGIDHPELLDTHGWALVHAGRVDEGIAELKRAVAKKPFAEGYYHLGHAYLKKSPPLVPDAERAALDAMQVIAAAERNNTPTDPTMRPKVEALLNQVRQLKNQ